jgi:hypothetical protein
VSAATSVILFASWWLPPLVLALILSIARQVEMQWRWFAAAAAAYAAYSLAGYWTLPEGIGSMPAEVRWYSRLSQLAAGAALTGLFWGRHELLTARGLGLVLKQAPSSLPWSLSGVAALVVLGLLPGGIDAGSGDAPGPLGLLYHLTLPGIEEELLYRGLLLSLFAVALGGTNKAIGGAAALSTMVFSLAHGIFPDEGSIGFNPFMIGYTALAGAILAGMRLRSGSLLFPAIGHNLIGLAMRLA